MLVDGFLDEAEKCSCPDESRCAIRSVMREVRENYDPHFDFVMIPRVPLDTLDFTSATMNLGSKMILDATRKQRPPRGAAPRRTRLRPGIPPLGTLDRRIVDQNLLDDTMLIVKVRRDGMTVLRKLLNHTSLAGLSIVVTVSDDVDIRDRENALWGIFTRFDCERDVLFAEQKLVGIAPVYGGVMGIDATWKPGYPAPLEMREDVKKKVEERWDRYWR